MTHFIFCEEPKFTIFFYLLFFLNFGKDWFCYFSGGFLFIYFFFNFIFEKILYIGLTLHEQSILGRVYESKHELRKQQLRIRI